MSSPAHVAGTGGSAAPGRRRTALRRHGATAVLVLCLGVLAATVLSSRSDLRLVSVQSGSMAPAVPAGALVLERLEPLPELSPGAVITYHAPTPTAPLLTHRVVAVDHSDGRTVVRTRGDANPGEDPWAAELLGDRVWVAVATLPWGGRLADGVGSPLGLVVVAGVLPGAFAVSTLRLIWRRDDGATRPTAAPGRARRLLRRWGRGPAALLVVSAGLAVGIGPPTPASAAFTARASGVHEVATLSLAAPLSITLADACPISGSAVDVRWTATGGAETGYRVERRTDPSPIWSTLATVPAGDRAYRDSTVVTLVQYTYRVSAVRGSWSSSPTLSSPLVLTGTCLS